MTVDTRAPAAELLRQLGIEEENEGAFCGRWIECSGEPLVSRNPATGETLAAVRTAGAAEYEQVAATAVAAFDDWRRLPAPARRCA